MPNRFPAQKHGVFNTLFRRVKMISNPTTLTSEFSQLSSEIKAIGYSGYLINNVIHK